MCTVKDEDAATVLMAETCLDCLKTQMGGSEVHGVMVSCLQAFPSFQGMKGNRSKTLKVMKCCRVMALPLA